MAKAELAILIFAFIASSTPFQVIWNVPTFMCHTHNVYFDLAQYSIIQNTDDEWHGDKVTIFYKPGAFPYYDYNNNMNPINGGLPQNADHAAHIDKFDDELLVKIPDVNFDGIAVLDFEQYEPCFLTARQFYKDESISLAGGNQVLAEVSFNVSSASLFKELVERGREMRPNAIWGYYHMPYCRNHNDLSACADRQIDGNTLMLEVYDTMDCLFPSLYLSILTPPEDQLVRSQTRIEEAIRLKGLCQNPKSIYSYVRLNYFDSPADFLTQSDLDATLGIAKTLNTDGVILWGSSFDLNTYDECVAAKDFVDQILGPYIVNLLSK